MLEIREGDQFMDLNEEEVIDDKNRDSDSSREINPDDTITETHGGRTVWVENTEHFYNMAERNRQPLCTGTVQNRLCKNNY